MTYSSFTKKVAQLKKEFRNESEDILNKSSSKSLYGLDARQSLLKKNGPWNMNEWSFDHSILNFKNRRCGSTLIKVGMAGAWFGVHCEDSDAASVNYLHQGKPKHWFGVPNTKASKLEKILQKMTQDCKCPTVWKHKCFVLKEYLLKKHKIEYTKLVQEPGEFVFTLYGGYHWGVLTFVCL